MKNFVAIAINGKYWIAVSKPTTQAQAEQFRGCEMKGEQFMVVPEKEYNKQKYKL